MQAKDMIDAMITSLKYNRETEYTMEVCHRIIKRIDNNYSYRPITANDKPVNQETLDCIEDDVNNIYGALVVLYGDYGTSPRSGWIECKPIEQEIKAALIQEIKDLAYRCMFEVKGGTTLC